MDTVSIRELIGDIELFRLVLDGFFQNWKGIYDILPFESDEYIFYPKEGFCPFCKALRSHPEGDELCLLCDHCYALEAAEKGYPIHYRCHAGLLDIAAPIIVNGKCLATVFCGQRRSWREEDLDYAKQAIPELEAKLEIDLMELWRETSLISEDELTDIKRRLTNLTRYLSEQWKEKLELLGMRRHLEFQVRERDAVRAALVRLNEVPLTEEMFWERLNQVLVDICDQFEATYGAILEIGGSEDAEPTLKARANLPEDFIGRIYPGNKGLIHELLENGEARVISFDLGPSNTLCYDIADLMAHDDWPDKVAYWPVYFGEENRGMLCLFLYKEREQSHSLAIEEELHILEPFTAQISSAYENCKLLQRERQLVDLQSRWLRDVVHEVEQPIHGILGYAEIWHDNLGSLVEHWPTSKETWSYDDVESLRNELESIEWMAINTSQVARNFAWIAGEEKKPDEVALVIDHDLAGTLIACARDKQGQARERNLTAVHVYASTIRPFNGRVRLAKDLFKQAMRNLLDNAVKYAYPETEVSIDAIQEDSDLIIRVKDMGIPILAGEEEIIFERHTRTRLAVQSGVSGAGIGLAIAREILELHSGTVRTSPSKRLPRRREDQYETIFEVVLPLIDVEEGRNV
jgi:signal transduction histidine kinase/ligand-binding sensor protein